MCEPAVPACAGAWDCSSGQVESAENTITELLGVSGSPLGRSHTHGGTPAAAGANAERRGGRRGEPDGKLMPASLCV